jgi:hypothetical protein
MGGLCGENALQQVQRLDRSELAAIRLDAAEAHEPDASRPVWGVWGVVW